MRPRASTSSTPSHSIVAFWPTSPIDSPRDLVGKALELLGHGMLPRMHGVFELRYGDDWHYKLRTAHRILPSVRHVPLHDPSVYIGALLQDAEAETFDKVFTVTTRASLEHIRDARNRWGHFAEISAMQASQDVREMQMLLADLGAADEARRMAQIQRTLDLMVRSSRS
ncbi:MAG: Swt1 family HEPN domain-containing protein [Acidimicrobiaceae bacterium]|nr:Swt1 family HEPN domain-containing protein [Acidimicrobiaceae bacterium]